MLSSEVSAAVEAFARATAGWPDAELDRPWAWRQYDEGVRVAFFRTYEELRELATTIAAERAVHGPSMSTAQRVLAQYHLAFRDLQAVLLGGAAGDLDRVPAEGEWPLRRVLEHMVRADCGFLVVTCYALDQWRGGISPPQAPPDEQSKSFWGDELARRDAALRGPPEAIIAFYTAVHDRILATLGGVTEEELPAPSLWWEEEELPIRFRLHRFDSHLRQHTIQAEKTLEAIGRGPTEAHRLLRHIFAALAEVEGAALGASVAAAGAQRDTAALIAARADEVMRRA
jgi:hypothetical protein